MSISHDVFSALLQVPVRAPAPTRGPRLHRLDERRRAAGLTLTQAAKRLGLTVAEVQEQLDPSTDLTLEQLEAWRGLLGCPIAALLVDDHGPVPPSGVEQEDLAELAQAGLELLEATRDAGCRRFTMMLLEQLLDFRRPGVAVPPQAEWEDTEEDLLVEADEA